METSKCVECGKTVAQKGRGRKRLTCSDTCRQKQYLKRKKAKAKADTPRTARILLYDIENTPMFGAAWGTYQTDLLEVTQESYVLSIAWKWLGEDDVFVYALPDFKKTFAKDRTNDFNLIKKWAQVRNEADIVVGHNVDRFDERKINARLLKHGITPPKPAASVDTLKVARKQFMLPNNRLDTIAKFLGIEGKLEHEGYGLWKKVMAGDDDAWKRMVEYNVQDVRLLEKVYLALRSWTPNHPVVTNIDEQLELSDQDVRYECPTCGSDHVNRAGFRRTRCFIHRRLRCMDCGSWFKGKSISVSRVKS